MTDDPPSTADDHVASAEADGADLIAEAMRANGSETFGDLVAAMQAAGAETFGELIAEIRATGTRSSFAVVDGGGAGRNFSGPKPPKTQPSAYLPNTKSQDRRP